MLLSLPLSHSSSGEEARTHYDSLRQNMATVLASPLNIATAMKAIQLPSKTPLDYFKETLCNESLIQDRLFGYADRSLVEQVRRAALDGEFAPEPSLVFFTPMRQSSFKQI